MNILLSGACGKMGKLVAELAEQQGETVVCGVDIRLPDSPNRKFPIVKRFSEVTQKADVLIDFSSPLLLGELLSYCEENGTPAVLASTGYSDNDLALIEKAVTDIALFKTGNLSFGVNVLQRLVKEAARILGDGFDAEIIERHHNEKKDAPSGTALMLADSVNEGFGGGKQNVYGRHGNSGARKPNEIGIHAVRGGTIVGEHEVMFAGEDEVLTLSHSAGSRRVFASGALRAARFLIGKPAGLYTMDDLLGNLFE